MNKSAETFVKNSMVHIPEGKELIRRFRDNKKWISSNYKMSIPSNGNNQSQSVEEVIVTSFYMSKYSVTNQLYNQIIGKSHLMISDELSPKVNISWLEAIKFCNKISLYYGLEKYYTLHKEDTEVMCDDDSNGFRLPTDAQWQYACKANSASYQYSDVETIAWHLGNSGQEVHTVGLKLPNNWGLYDMLGNVWEWCWDLYNPETYDSYRIFRGGSFAEESRVCGATTRRKSLPTFAIDDLGFRIVKPR